MAWLQGQPQIVQMFMGMKDPGSSKRGAVIAGTTGVFLLFGSFLVNLCCIVLFPNSENTSTNFIQMITQYTPHWLVGIVTAAILAAVMSSADALLHVATTAVTQDFYNKMLKKGQATDKEVLLAARVSSVLIGAFAIYIAFNPFDSILWVNWWAWGRALCVRPHPHFGILLEACHPGGRHGEHGCGLRCCLRLVQGWIEHHPALHLCGFHRDGGRYWWR